MNLDRNTPFQSFWMGGFECADHINAFGERVDLVRSSGHADHIKEDYQLGKKTGIVSFREGVRWGQIERKPYYYDWSLVESMIIHAGEENIQIIWDLCHFGFPADLTPLHPMFARRFSAYCQAFVLFYRSLVPSGPLIIVPINEVSFISWLGGEVKGTVPFCVSSGWHVKYALMKAYIESIESMMEVDTNIIIMTSEPLINIVPSDMSCHEAGTAANLKNDDQFQVLEILSGNMCPELRGKPEYLNILGFNYYANNHWKFPDQDFLDWKVSLQSQGGKCLSELISEVYKRYNRPVVLTETSHPGEDKSAWIYLIQSEVLIMLRLDIPLQGVCWYPLIDRLDWDHPDIWHSSGLWSRNTSENGISDYIYDRYAFIGMQNLISSQRDLISAALVSIKSEAF